jgi:hypothetical protein
MDPQQLRGGSSSSIGDPAKFGVLTVSDRASAGVYDDLSGPAILKFFGEAIESPWEADYRVIPDEQPLIEQAIIDMVGGWVGHQGRQATPAGGRAHMAPAATPQPPCAAHRSTAGAAAWW